MNAADLFDAWRKRPSSDALLAVLKRSQDSVYNLCFQVLRHSQDAEDAAQRVFLDLLPLIHEIRSADHLRHWLHRASLQTALNLRRGERRRMRHERTRSGSAPQLLSEVDAVSLHEHLAQLGDEERGLLVEHYFERRTLAEMATARGCSTVAVWKRLQKAQETLRHSLTHAGLAALAIGVTAFLGMREAVAAPAGLLSTPIVAKAGSVASRGALESTALAGGIALKSKILLLTTVAVVLATSALGYASYRIRVASRAAWLSGVSGKSKRANPAGVRSAVSSAGGPEGTTLPEERVTSFECYEDFSAAFRRALAIPSEVERWKALRRLGLRRSDEEFWKAYAKPAAFPERSFGLGKAKKGTRKFSQDVFRTLLLDWMESAPAELASFLKSAPPVGSLRVSDLSGATFAIRSGPRAPLLEDPAIWEEDAGPACEKWAEKDPKRAMAFLKLLPEEWERAKEFRVALEFRARLESDPEGFLAWVQTSAAGEDLSPALDIAIPYWAAVNPQAAAQWTEHLPPGLTRWVALGRIARQWAGANRPAAQDWAGKYMDGYLRTPKRDVSSNPVTYERCVVLDNFLVGAAQGDPRWAIRVAEEWDSEHLDATRSVIAVWARHDLDAAAQWVERSGSPRAVRVVSDAMAEKDPARAIAWIQKLPTRAEPDRLVAQVFENWVKASDGPDPQEVYKTLGSLPEGLRSDAEMGLVRGWAEVDPKAAARFIDQSPQGGVTLESIASVAGALAAEDPVEALSWVRSLTSSRSRSYALEAIAPVVADTDLTKAMDIAGEISDADLRHEARLGAIEKASERNPSAAAAALENVADATLETYERVAKLFARKDPRAALAWAQTLLETRQEATIEETAIPGTSLFTNPRASTQEVALRNSVIESILRTWADKDAESATRWVEQADLSQATKEALRQLIAQE